MTITDAPIQPFPKLTQPDRMYKKEGWNPLCLILSWDQLWHNTETEANVLNGF